MLFIRRKRGNGREWEVKKKMKQKVEGEKFFLASRGALLGEGSLFHWKGSRQNNGSLF